MGVPQQVSNWPRSATAPLAVRIVGTDGAFLTSDSTTTGLGPDTPANEYVLVRSAQWDDILEIMRDQLTELRRLNIMLSTLTSVRIADDELF